MGIRNEINEQLKQFKALNINKHMLSKVDLFQTQMTEFMQRLLPTLFL